MKYWTFIYQCMIPGFFMTAFPIVGILMLKYASEDDLSGFRMPMLFGNTFTWTCVALFLVWAVVFMKTSSKVFYGPPTYSGHMPKYVANGFQYYCVTVSSFIVLNWKFPIISILIFQNMPELIGTLSTVAFVLCLYLWCKGKYHPETHKENFTKYPAIFEFYCGTELHPHIFDLNVKQLTNCRMGMMLWQILVITFIFADGYQHGFVNCGTLVNVLLQSIYISKFFWWETGYFTTLDMTMDCAGFYLCWGCLAFMPMLMPYATYYFVFHPPTVTMPVALGMFFIGVMCIYLNYEVDRQKQHFRAVDGQCQIWNERARFIDAEFMTATGVQKNKLLLSGFWGVARHMNYVFDFLAGLLWNLPGWNVGFMSFVYNIFLIILLMHRVYRDEDKCLRKYGTYWKAYRMAVPYRLIPYVY